MMGLMGEAKKKKGGIAALILAKKMGGYEEEDSTPKDYEYGLKDSVRGLLNAIEAKDDARVLENLKYLFEMLSEMKEEEEYEDEEMEEDY